MKELTLEEKSNEFLSIIRKYCPDFDAQNFMKEDDYKKILKRIRREQPDAEQLLLTETVKMVFSYLYVKMVTTATTSENFDDALAMSYGFVYEWFEKMKSGTFPRVSKDWDSSIKSGKYVEFNKYKKSVQTYVKSNLQKEDTKEKEGNAYLYHGWQTDINVEQLPELSI